MALLLDLALGFTAVVRTRDTFYRELMRFGQLTYLFLFVEHIPIAAADHRIIGLPKWRV